MLEFGQQTNNHSPESLPTNFLPSTPVFDFTGAPEVVAHSPVMPASALVNLLTAPHDPIVSDLIVCLRATMQHPEAEVQALAAATLRIVHEIQRKAFKRSTMSKAELNAERLKIEAEQLEQLAQRCAEALHIDFRLLKDPAHNQQVAIKRQLAMFLCRKLLGASFPSIGRCFNRDHSTVIHSSHLITQRLAQDEAGGFRRFVSQLEQQVSSADATATEGAGLTGAGSLPQLAQVAA